MKLTRGSLTQNENIALVVTIVLAALLYILGPAAYAAATETAPSGGRSVPAAGTPEYEAFISASEFEAEHGRPDEEYRQEPASRPWVAAEGDADVQG